MKDKKYKVLYPDLTLMMASAVSTAHNLSGMNLPKPQELADDTHISDIDIKILGHPTQTLKNLLPQDS